jgi:parallel beta-helix repeat protein
MNKSVGLLLVLVLLLASSITTTPLPVKAEPKTIVVPDDYPTIKKAVEEANTGDTVFVRKGTYNVDEPNQIIIDKPLSLIGEDVSSTIVNQIPLPYGYGGITITVAASDVTISGLTITNSGLAIQLRNWAAVQENGSYISNVRIIGNKILNSEEGIWVETGNNVVLKNNEISGSYNFAIHVYPQGRNVLISENNIIGNGLAKFSGGGVYLWGATNTTIAYNSFSANLYSMDLYFCGPTYIYGNNITDNQYGILFNEACHNATVTGNNIVGNDVGVYLPLFPIGGISVEPGSMFYRNNLVNNSEQARVEKPANATYGSEIVAWDNGKQGNYWSDYLTKYPNASEMPTSGIGDTPFVIDENNIDRYPLIERVLGNIDFTAPTILVLSPENRTYDTSRVQLDFTVSEVVSEIRYSLDGEENITIVGNMTLTGLANGDHNLTIYASDEEGNVGASESMHFSVNVPFPAALAIASVIIVAVACIGLMIYFKKRKR